MPSCGIGLGLPYAGTGIDPDALSYFSRAGISSAAQTPTTFQNASTFSGTTQSLTVTSNSTLQVGGSSFSFSCWFNPSVASGPQTLIQKTASGALEYSFGIGGAGQVRGLIGNAGSSWAVINDSAFNPSAGRWTQAVLTYDGTTLRIYINGSLSSSASGPAITTSGTAPLEIGRETGAAFNGSISSVGFWKRAISASEVTALFNSGSGRTYASLDSSIRTNMVSWWDLSETSGNRADSFGSNTLTNNNSVGTTSQGVIVTGTANSRALILDFVKGVKALGLWNNFVCWPLRSSQNAGTGTTAFSLGGLGTFNGTLVNGPTWGANGVSFLRASTQAITTPALPATPAPSCLFDVAYSPLTLASDRQSVVRWGGSPNTNTHGIWHEWPFAVNNLEGGGVGFSVQTPTIIPQRHLSLAGVVSGGSAKVGYLQTSTTNAQTGTDNVSFSVVSSGVGIGGASGTLASFAGEVSFVAALNNVLPTSTLYGQMRTLLNNTLFSGLTLPA
jgi:hypothetical protein